MDLLATAATFKPSVRGALLLVARAILVEAGMPAPSLDEIQSMTGAGRSQVYARVAAVLGALATIDAPPVTPPPQREDATSRLYALAAATRDLLMSEPGAAACKGSRASYTVAFRRFAIAAMEPSGCAYGLTLAECALGLGVPIDTLRDWLRPAVGVANGTAGEGSGDASATDATPSPVPTMTVSDAHTATVLNEWQRWRGTFTAFCAHVKEHHRVPYGTTHIATVLRLTGLRKPARRKKPATPWSRSTFERYFPGAKWVGDGKQVDLVLNGQTFRFNLEAMVDGAVGAPIGVHVSDAEDGAAVIDAFEHAKTTTGAAPAGVQLDHRPSNWTDTVKDAIAPAELVPSTPGRGQSKPSVEGAFGLFSQIAPPLDVSGATPRALARSILSLFATLWAWSSCTKPRRVFGGKSAAEIYLDAKPTADDLERAREHFADLCRRVERMRQSALARANPIRIAILEAAFAELGLADPKRHFATSFARYANDAITEGIAVFQAKKERGTLPPNADVRYLGGIIRNIDTRDELQLTSDHLLAQRLRARDLTLAPLWRELDALRANATPHDQALVAVLVTRALDAEPAIDHRFWSLAAAQALERLHAHARIDAYRHCARLITTHYHADRDRRAALLSLLASAAVTIDAAA